MSMKKYITSITVYNKHVKKLYSSTLCVNLTEHLSVVSCSIVVIVVIRDGKKFSKRQNDVHVEHYKVIACCSSVMLLVLCRQIVGLLVQCVTVYTVHSSWMPLVRLVQLYQLCSFSADIGKSQH